jgi:small subunit ribosomal protein S3
VAENIASQIERRISHRRAMKQSILRTMRAGAKGVRIGMAGRLRGGEMARRESDHEGKVPLHTLRADIKFGRATARTTYGVIGVKVWIYKDLMKSRTRGGQSQEEVFPQPQAEGRQPAPEAGGQAAPAVASGTHAEAPAVAPGAPAAAGEAVRQQVSAERGGSSPRRRSPRSEGAGGSARPATPRPAAGRSQPPERSVTPQEAVPHDESTETGTQAQPGSPAAEPGSPATEEDRGAPS